MIIFRGLRTDGRRWVEGSYFNKSKNSVCPELNHTITDGVTFADYILPGSLAIGDTTLKDKTGKVIFASFEYEEGKMSRGGDIAKIEDISTSINYHLRFIKISCFFKNGVMNFHKTKNTLIEIIGNQYERSQDA